MESNSDILVYTPIKSFVHSSFWHKLCEIKIDIDKLCDKPKKIHGFYTNINCKSCLVEVDYSSFNEEFKPPNKSFVCHGTLYNTNTIEEFKQYNKIELLKNEGNLLCSDILSGNVLNDPSLLCRFLLLSFADLKTHKFIYWFAFPCPIVPVSTVIEKKDILSSKFIDYLSLIYRNTDCYKNKMFFILVDKGNLLENYKLTDYISAKNKKENFKNVDMNNLYFCFVDPSEYENPGWFLRTFMAMLYILCPVLHGKTIKLIGIRGTMEMVCGTSRMWTTKISEKKEINNDLKFLGWELNDYDKLAPRLASLSDSMDEKKLAENSILLNLKLMKWRLLKDLKLELISETKCLLIGAGTLGCAVSRNLLAWGFKQISFIDNGFVRYSNPVRQSLYVHADAVAINKSKALTAALRLKEINPNTIVKGYNMQIPMPGHTVGKCTKERLINEVKEIEKLIQEHDVIFLLTDSRESRWLPTVLGTYFKKIVINVALGFDSYLVMRHGCKSSKNVSDDQVDIGDLRCIDGADLGCYFCHDVTAPGDSMRGRTLDQQCTVTRPGVSNIASSYAVELLVALLHHDKKNLAPAYFSLSGKSEQNIPEGPFGILPHSIRGILGTFENIKPATRKFAQCIACSEKILNEYKNRNVEFLLDVFNTTEYLLDLTGISGFGDLEIIVCDDEDWDN